jgi:hypothetical protein
MSDVLEPEDGEEEEVISYPNEEQLPPHDEEDADDDTE